MQEFIAYLEQHPGLFVALGGIATAIGTIGGWLINSFSSRKVKVGLLEEVETLHQQIGASEQTNQHQANVVKEQAAEIENLRVQAQAQSDSHVTKCQQLNEEIEKVRDELDGRDRAMTRQRNLVKQMMKLEGQLWEKKSLNGRPKFRPLHERRMPIISIMNLKGGVGKTTITSHLTTALAAKGYRVLAIDLDLQGSLSGMFLDGTEIKERYDEGKLLQHFLNTTTHKRKVNLLEYVREMNDGKCGIVATSDKLAYAEMNLTMSWLLRISKRDTRFLLLRALHQKRISNQYDIVLIDCPPLINTCCVNALAASDYVLIPTIPSKKSAERIPMLVDSIKRFRGNVNPNLEVAGIVFNRTHGAELVGHEATLWNQILAHTLDRNGVPVYGFTTNIRQDKEVRKLESEHAPLQPGTDLYDTFRKLAEELEERLPSECRRTATASY
jgi:cellulose biosynthesis protein BcsQ